MTLTKSNTPTRQYMYLISISILILISISIFDLDLNLNQYNLMKLIAFFKCNTDMPFIVKKKVMDAAFMSAIMYGCESWLGVCVKDMDKIYHAALKALLGVRTTTVNDLCLAELGYPLIKYYVLQRQRWFFKKMIDSRSGLDDDPLMLAINLAQDSGSKMGTAIDMVTQSDD